MIRNSYSKGFTLVELLVVIAIIGTLATLLLLQLGTARAKARDTKRIADLNQMRSAMEQFFDDNGNYPNNYNITILKSALVPKYIASIPQDPLIPPSDTINWNGGSGYYNYAYETLIDADRPTKFHLWVELETKSNALNGDADLNSAKPGWGGGLIDARDSAVTEVCSDSDRFNANCIYDLGQQ